MKKVIVHKSAAPIYIAAAAWGIYALVFPLYRVGHFAIAAAVSLAAYFVGRCFFKDVKEEVEVEPEPIRTGNQALDEMIAQGQLAMQEMRRLDDNIKDEVISGQIRKFMNYYLPTTLKLLDTYDRMGAQGVSGGNIGATMERVENIMGTIVAAFEKQLDALFGAEALDISTDITVLENMMAREGLAEDAVHRTVNEEKEDKTEPSDGGIQLEL